MALSPKLKIDALSASLEVANRFMVVFLVIAAVAATVVAVATFLVVRWQGRLDQLKDADFESYKVDAATTIADAGAVAATANRQAAEANARAVEAQLALERFKAPRAILAYDVPTISASIATCTGMSIDVMVLGEGPEPRGLGAQIRQLLSDDHVGGAFRSWTGCGALQGVATFWKPADQGAERCATALAAAFNAAHVQGEAVVWPGPDWDHFGGLMDGAMTPDAVVRIVVGSKPQ